MLTITHTINGITDDNMKQFVLGEQADDAAPSKVKLPAKQKKKPVGTKPAMEKKKKAPQAAALELEKKK